ncbi:MAG: hypothetical protein NUV51_00645 [Sulfuricaulis sp.]|nr:hypothetical protein [Sulfuricaulis sp.]
MTETAIAAAFDALIRALHAQHVHATACGGEQNCRDCALNQAAAHAERERYEEMVLGKKTFQLPTPETTDHIFLRKQAD